MIRLDDVKMFVRSSVLGSFSQAAREAGLLPGQVSAAIQRLERELNVRLFVRSTRSLRLTAQGAKYLPFAHEMLEVVKAGVDSLQTEEDSLQGELKIALPSDIGRHCLLPLISGFCQQHPLVAVRLQFSDEVSDIYRDPVDIAVRYGVLPDSSYVALPLAADNSRVLVASPEYLAREGEPQSLEEITRRECLLYSLNGQVHDSWRFRLADGPQVISVHGRHASNDAEVTRRLALAGVGIAYKSRLDVEEDIASGRLVPLLVDLAGEAAPLNFICPHRSQFSTLVRQLYNHLRQHFTAAS